MDKCIIYIIMMDSHLKYCAAIESEFRTKNNGPGIVLIARFKNRILLDQSSVQSVMGTANVSEYSDDKYRELLKQSNVCAVMCVVTGDLNAHIINIYHDLFESSHYEFRPCMMNCFHGIDLHPNREGHFNRLGADYTFVLGQYDIERLLEEYPDYPSSAIEPVGLPYLNKTPQLKVEKQKKQLLFVGQIRYPESRRERLHIIQSFIDICHGNTGIEVIIKPRVRPENNSSNVAYNPHHYQNIIEEEGLQLPSNMRVSYEDIERLISEADRIITLSSTAVFDGYVQDKPFSILVDPIFNKMYGQQYFDSSGAFVTYDQIRENNYLEQNHKWVNHRLACMTSSSLRIIELMDKFTQKQISSGHRTELAKKALCYKIKKQKIVAGKCTIYRIKQALKYQILALKTIIGIIMPNCVKDKLSKRLFNRFQYYMSE